jgi:uridine kinase
MKDNLSLIHELIFELENLSRNKEVVLISIDGAGGAGKTSLAELILKSVVNSVIVQLDDFYSPALQCTDLLRLKRQVIIPLISKQAAKYQIYEWQTDSFSDWHELKPAGIFIFEGVYALDQTIRNYYDLTVWIETPADVGFERGVARDIARDGVDNTDKWKNVWMPMEEKYRNEQEPGKFADYIIDGIKLFQ